MIAQASSQITVNLDHAQALQRLRQRSGQGREARTNFHHIIDRPRANRTDDLVDDGLIFQKVLSKALARLMLGHTYP
jgi:hypothetical protein